MWKSLLEFLRKLLEAIIGGGEKPPVPPDPPDPPTPDPGGTPEKGTPLGPERLLRIAPGTTTLTDNRGELVQLFMAIPCCMQFELDGKAENSRWPLASESWMDHTEGNAFHFRLGPFYGDADHESEWADIGGPYIGQGPDFNPVFWSKVRDLAWHAYGRGAWVEINIIDTWYCKHAQWGDQQIPWPEVDVEACGRKKSPEQERYLRKAVSELGCFGNVIWTTDNEGDQISGDTREWYEWVREVIRDEEQKSGCGFVHLVGTNNTLLADGPFDYVATHARAPLTGPIGGKFTLNNEHNPEFSPEQEASYFSDARRMGLAWALWRAGMETPEFEETLGLFKKVVKGDTVVGCFAPPAEDEQWDPNPLTPDQRGPQMLDAIRAAQATVGDRCGREPTETLALIAKALRDEGHCASGPWADAVAIKAPDGLWEEMHVVSYGNGCYTQNQTYKGAWKYLGSTGDCPGGTPKVDEIVVKLHQATNHIYDSTPKVNGQPIRPEGDPSREACEREACGGVPDFRLTSDTLSLTMRPNPYQFKISGTGRGTLNCTCPSTGPEDLCGSKVIEQ